MVMIEGITFWKAQCVWLTTTLVNLWIVGLSWAIIYGIGWAFGEGIKKAKKKR